MNNNKSAACFIKMRVDECLRKEHKGERYSEHKTHTKEEEGEFFPSKGKGG